MLTFPVVLNQLGTYGEDLITLDAVGAHRQPARLRAGHPEQFSLILIAVLMMVFQESAFGVIRHLEYAYRLPSPASATRNTFDKWTTCSTATCGTPDCTSA